MSIARLDDVRSWATSHSCTRLTSVARFGLQKSVDADSVSSLQDILRIVQERGVAHIPYNELSAVESVGEGATFSVVTHYWSGKLIALKYIKQPSLDDRKDLNAFRRRLQSVAQEITVMQHGPLASHPNILALLGYGWQDTAGRPSPYLAVEYGSLGSLRLYLQSKKPSLLRNKLILAGDIAAGITALHRASIIHGDLKLDNAVCFNDWSRPSACIAKVCDFGHSMIIPEDPKTVYYYGTPRYLPPETFNQQERPISSTDAHKCDIWAFGLALWEILIDGDVYLRPEWREDPPQYAAAGSLSSSSPACELSAEDPYSAIKTSQTSDTPSSRMRSIFGALDLAELRGLAQNMVKSLDYKSLSWGHFALGFLQPLLRRCLDPDPTARLSDLSRSPITARWREAAPQSALESKLAFHTLSSQLGYNIFRPDIQADIAWHTQTHIYEDIKLVAQSRSSPSAAAHASLQLALCHMMGFGCQINVSEAKTHLHKGMEHDLDFAAFAGGPLSASLDNAEHHVCEPFTVRLAKLFGSRWSLDISGHFSLRAKASLDPAAETDESDPLPIRLTALGTLSDMLSEASAKSMASSQDVIAQSSVYSETQRLSLSWLDLAILLDDLPFIKTHIQDFPPEDLNRIDQWTNTPLILACCRGSTRIVKFLLKHGADPALSTPESLNLLHVLFGLTIDAVEILQTVLELGHSSLLEKINEPCQRTFHLHPQWPTEISGTPLAIAVTAGHLDLVKALLDLNASALSPAFLSPTTDSRNVWTPCHLAVKYNFVDIHKALLGSFSGTILVPGQIHSLETPIATPLCYLTPPERYGIHGANSSRALDDVVKCLGKGGLSKADHRGMTPLLQALDFRNAEVVASILKHAPALAGTRIPDPTLPSRFTLPLHFACQISGRHGSSDALLVPKQVVAVDRTTLRMQDDANRSPLHLAVTAEHSFVTKWLVSEGLNPDACDSSGRTPLMLSHSLENTKYLLSLGVDISKKDKQGRNAAHYAVSRRDYDTLAALVEHNINLNVSSETGGTPLHDAVRMMSLDCIRLLCKAGVSLRARDANGSTPLHLAVSTTADIVMLLVDKGSDIFLNDGAGVSAVQSAAARTRDLPADVRQPYNILRSLISPLCGSREMERRNRQRLLEVQHIIARWGDIQAFILFRDLLDLKSDIGVDEPYNGRTTLHAAVIALNVEIGHTLIRQGVDVNARDWDGNTPLMLLCSTRCGTDAAELFYNLLITSGAIITYCNKANLSAWDLAVQHESFSLVKELLYDIPDQDLVDGLTKEPLTRDHVQKAARVGEPKLLLALASRAHLSAFGYEPALSSALSNALMCANQWSVISDRLAFVNKYYAGDLLRLLNNEPLSNEASIQLRNLSRDFVPLVIPTAPGKRRVEDPTPTSPHSSSLLAAQAAWSLDSMADDVVVLSPR